MIRSSLLLLLIVAVSRGQDAPVDPAKKKVLLAGTHVLRYMLHDHGFKSLEDMPDLGNEPSRTLLIALGDLEVIDRIPDGLADFLERGGAVLLASDRPLQNKKTRNTLQAVAGVSISAEKVSRPGGRECHESLPFCPFLQPADYRVGRPQLLTHLGQRLQKVATNVPSMLFDRRRDRDRADLVAHLPEGCVVETKSGYQPIAVSRPIFGVADSHGAGRYLVLADHSLFINEMMMPTSTDNVEFTGNCLRWLREGRRTRDRVLVMENGRPQTKLDLPMKSARLPWEELLRIIWERRNTFLVEGERALATEENKGSFGPRLLAWIQEETEITPGRLAGWTLAALAILGLFYFAWRVGFVERFGHDRTAEPLLQAVDDRLPDRPLMAQRIETMMHGDAREPLRLLAASLFDGPIVVHKGGWFSTLSSRLKRAQRLARGWPVPIKPRWVSWWQRELDDLRRRRENGEWGRADGQLAA